MILIRFRSLSGKPPFNDPIPKDLFERIAQGDYNFDEEPWDTISDEGNTSPADFSCLLISKTAKDLISKLLIVDPAKRMSVRAALDHTWFTEVFHYSLLVYP